MNRSFYNGYPYAYALFPTPQFYRDGDVHCKGTLVLPSNVLYTTDVEPKFINQLIQHIGLLIVITTTVGKLVGTLENVFIDHVALVVHGKKHHIRLSEIVYFEIAEEK